ncbi:TRAP transporter large permease subunit [Sphingobium naphthae]|nr:TRAP transporter large permease subunit [Sphingobium naphthae]
MTTSIALALEEGSPMRDSAAWSRMEAPIGLALEVVTATLVVAEVLVLFSGIVGRAVGHPLIWADEVASIIFLWLAMLGAVVALRRSQHMRMGMFVGAMPAPVQAFLESFASTAVAIFLLIMLHPAVEYVTDEMFLQTPVLGLPMAWRIAAMPVGIACMLVISMFRLARNFALVPSIAGLFCAIFAGIIGYHLSPVLHELGNYNLLLFFVVVLLAAILSGVPIAFAFGLATAGYIGFTTDIPVAALVGTMDEGMTQILLLAIPLFIFLGLLIEMTGMAAAIVGFLASFLGNVRGGMSYVLISAMYLVSGVSGSKTADMAAIAPALFPDMQRRGSKPGDLAALLSVTGAQTETVPPSLVLITIASVSGVSVGALFKGGLLPSLFLGAILCAVVWWRHRKVELQPGAKVSKRVIAQLGFAAAPALILPFIIRYAVLEGLTTATEVSTIGIIYSIFIGLVFYRRFEWSRLLKLLVDTASLAGAILFIIGTATSMAYALTRSGFSMELTQAMSGLPGGMWAFLAVSLVAFTLLGSILEGIPAIVLFGPLLFPVAKQFGVNDVHYAIVVVLAMGIGLFSPPFGVGYYSACAIGGVSPDKGIRPIIGYMLALFLGIMVITFVPWITLALV